MSIITNIAEIIYSRACNKLKTYIIKQNERHSPSQLIVFKNYAYYSLKGNLFLVFRRHTYFGQVNNSNGNSNNKDHSYYPCKTVISQLTPTKCAYNGYSETRDNKRVTYACKNTRQNRYFFTFLRIRSKIWDNRPVRYKSFPTKYILRLRILTIRFRKVRSR